MLSYEQQKFLRVPDKLIHTWDMRILLIIICTDCAQISLYLSKYSFLIIHRIHATRFSNKKKPFKVITITSS